MTHLSHYPAPLDKLFVDINWPASRCWRRLTPVKAPNGANILYIHIPKCAGTSVTSHLGLDNIHLTANVLNRSDCHRYRNCLSFSTLRNPLQRRLSILRHFASSRFAENDDKRKFKQFIEPRLNSTELHKLFSDFILKRLVFSGATAGRAGFSSNQLDWISCSRSGAIIVDYLIPLNDSFSQNYSNFCQTALGFTRSTNILHENISSMRFSESPFSSPDLYIKLESLDRKLFVKEWLLWDFVNQNGVSSSEEVNIIINS